MQYKFYQYPRGANKGGILKTEICPTISTSSWENNCFLIEIMQYKGKEIQPYESFYQNSRCVKTDNRLATLVMEEKRITITSGQQDNLLLEPKVMQVGNIIDDSERDFKNPQCGRIYSADGLSPTLNTCQGGNREPKVLRINTATKQGYDEVVEGACFDGAYNDSTTRRDRVQENGNVTPTLCTSNEVCYYESSEPEFRICKLTPRECFRLMGVSENNIDKIQNAGISNSQQYKLAGNSIVVDVLYHIFRKAFIEKENECDQLTLF